MDPIQINMNVTGLPEKTKKVHLAPHIRFGYDWDAPRRSAPAEDEPTVGASKGASGSSSSWKANWWALVLAAAGIIGLAFWAGRNGHASETTETTTKSTTVTETQPGSGGGGATGAEGHKPEAPPPPRPSPSPEPTPEPTSPPVEEPSDSGKKFQIELPDGTKIWTDDPDFLEKFSKKSGKGSGKGSVGKKSHQDHSRDGHKGGQEIVDEMRSDRGGGNGQGCRCPPGSHQNQCGPNCDRPRQVTVEPLAQVAQVQSGNSWEFINGRDRMGGFWVGPAGMFKYRGLPPVRYCVHGVPPGEVCRECGGGPGGGYLDRKLARVVRVNVGVGAGVIYHAGGDGGGNFRGGFDRGGGGRRHRGGGGGPNPPATGGGGGGFTFGGRGRN